MSNQEIKIVFFGTPDFAAEILESLLEKKFNVVSVVTQPDKKIGRNQKIVHSPVKELAIKSNIKIFQPESLRDKIAEENLEDMGADLFIVAAYGKILPQNVLDIPKYGAINVHASLLPRYRGASPIQCAILNAEKETGITIMKMNERMDEGDILEKVKISIDKNDTAEDLFGKLSKLGTKVLSNTISKYISGEIIPFRQNDKEATYCQPIKREDGRIDWINDDAEKIFQKWRAYQPWPGIYAFYETKGELRRLKFKEIEVGSEIETGKIPGETVVFQDKIAVQTKKGVIFPKIIQLEGKKESAIGEFSKGNREFAGSQLK
jgi:methionyl-tRNA formyltransferase